METSSLPLLIQKQAAIRGSELLHETVSPIGLTDNSSVQWSCSLALREILPTPDDFDDAFTNDARRVSFVDEKHEKY